MSRMITVVYSTGGEDLVEEAVEYLVANSTTIEFTPHSLNSIVVVDNGTDIPFDRQKYLDIGADDFIRIEENVGGNGIIPYMIPYAQAAGAEFIAYLHCDLMVVEPEWDKRVVAAFDADPKLGLTGFVGSNAIDRLGGRGLATRLNFQGRTYRWGQGSAAKYHGIPSPDVYAAAVLDHCALIFRLRLLEQMPTDHPPAHFYDRIVCLEMLSRGYHVATIGIACDHMSGGQRGGINEACRLYEKWLLDHNCVPEIENLDRQLYLYGEKQYLEKWRDQSHFIPVIVNKDYSIQHHEPDWTNPNEETIC